MNLPDLNLPVCEWLNLEKKKRIKKIKVKKCVGVGCVAKCVEERRERRKRKKTKGEGLALVTEEKRKEKKEKEKEREKEKGNGLGWMWVQGANKYIKRIEDI